MKGKAVKTTDRQFTDKETGEIITLGESHENLLLSLEHQIVNNYVQVALALKTIRDEHLYFLRGCDSMQDYCAAYLGMSRRHVYNHLHVADHFSEKLLGKVSRANVPMQALLDLTKNAEVVGNLEAAEIDPDNDRVVYADGSVEPLSKALERAREVERKKAGKKLSDSRDLLNAKDRMIESYNERLEEAGETIKDLRGTITDLVSKKDVDPSTVVFVTQKKEALRLLDDAAMSVIDTFNGVSGIPQTLLDPDVTAKLTHFISSMEAGLERLREIYGSVVWLPRALSKGEVVPD